MSKPSLPRYSDVLEPDDDVGESPLHVAAQRLLNAAIRGRLEIDYDTRSVTFRDIDGDHAMRLLAISREFRSDDPTTARWADQLDPRTSDAGCRWINIRPERVLSIRWFPERILIEDDEHRCRVAVALALLGIDDAPAAAEQTEEAADDEGETAPDAADEDDDTSDNVLDDDSVASPPTERASPPPAE